MYKIERSIFIFLLIKMELTNITTHALPSRALPNRILPSRALLIISEYSKPMTRPDWRQSKPLITTYYLYLKTRGIKIYNKNVYIKV